MPVNKINRHACRLVKAETQSKLIGILEEQLTENELSVYKRGRNAKSYTSAKNATIGDYRRATGFEALMGYLYLDGQYDRLTKLVHTGLEAIGEWEHHRMEKKMRYKEFIIEGRNAVLEAFRAGKTIDKLFVLDGCQDGPVKSILREAKKTDTIINFVDKETAGQTGKQRTSPGCCCAGGSI